MKLLNRATLNYLIYSIIVLLIVTPLFYLIIERLFIEDVDESLMLRKQEIQFRVRKIKSHNDLQLWSDLDGDIKWELAKGITFRDTIFYTVQYDSLADEMEPYRVLSSTIMIDQVPYHLTTRISLVENEDLVSAIAIIQGIVLGILLTGLLVINWRVSKRIWRPFYDTIEKLEKFELERSPILKLDSPSIKEFQLLNTAIGRLADRTYKAYINQKEFTENAAHEMQTPLAIFQSKVELLMQDKNLSNENALLLGQLMDASSRLSKLNKALLLLSKIENKQFIETESIDLVELTEKLVVIFQRQAETKNIEIRTFFLDRPRIFFNASLIDILLSNLISNAVRYNNANGSISITVTGKSWEIINTGNPLDIPVDRIFERFQKGNSGQSSTGLGLAIVKKICETRGSEIRYEFKSNTHSFSLWF
ncbi:HAMP domain-containing sensor histidine kinase [soil metagenome]